MKRDVSFARFACSGYSSKAGAGAGGRRLGRRRRGRWRRAGWGKGAVRLSPLSPSSGICYARCCRSSSAVSIVCRSQLLGRPGWPHGRRCTKCKTLDPGVHAAGFWCVASGLPLFRARKWLPLLFVSLTLSWCRLLFRVRYPRRVPATRCCSCAA